MKIKIMKYFNKLLFIIFLCKYKIYFRKIYFYLKSKRNVNLTDIFVYLNILIKKNYNKIYLKLLIHFI